MTRKFVTGVEAIERQLRHLSDKGKDRVSRSALGGGLTVVRREIKKAAPKESGLLKKSIGRRLEKRKGNRPMVAKAGINVGKTRKGKTANRAPHGHLVALGTGWRQRRGGGSTGRMPANTFVRDATRSSRAAALKRMQEFATKALAREAKRNR